MSDNGGRSVTIEQNTLILDHEIGTFVLWFASAPASVAALAAIHSLGEGWRPEVWSGGSVRLIGERGITHLFPEALTHGRRGTFTPETVSKALEAAWENRIDEGG